MRRRDFIKVLGGGVAASPLSARAQRTAMPVIGYLAAGAPNSEARLHDAFRQRAGGVRLRNRQERQDRIPVGGEPVRSTAVDGGRSGSSGGGRARSDDHTCGSRRKSCDGHDSDRLHDDRRSGADRIRHQSEPARRQCYRGDHVERGGRTEARGIAPRGRAFGRHDGSARQSDQSECRDPIEKHGAGGPQARSQTPRPECQH